jgi:hypothetical protein
MVLLAGFAAAQNGDAESDLKTNRKDLTQDRAVAAVRKMRERLNDPDSLRVVSVVYYEPQPPEFHSLCVTFRARNEHGGIVFQAFSNNASDTSHGGFNNQVAWSVMCKGEIVLDATDAVKAALKVDRDKAEKD